jgi:uncharacterized protein YeaO (DUF488 family)
MITIKHFLETPEVEDGMRLWVEPFGVTRDLCDWCRIGVVLSEIGPPPLLWDWFDLNPSGYESFRKIYHAYLSQPLFASLLQKILDLSERVNVTLLHQSTAASENTAAALCEFLLLRKAEEPASQETNGLATPGSLKRSTALGKAPKYEL